MKTIHAPKALIYDSDCTLCAAYSRAFVKLGVLGPHERIAFAELDRQEFIARLDAQRQGNEIPLVDLGGGTTLYGIDALLCLLERRWPLLVRVCRVQPFYGFFRRLYALISYNRRIILAKNYCSSKYNCAPAFNRNYRIAFLFVAAIIAGLITYAFGEALAACGNEMSFINGARMLVICSVGWALTLLAALLFMKGEKLSYAGHLATLQLIGTFVLLPAVMIAPLIGKAGIVLCAVSVLASSLLMLRGHYRRVQLLGLSQRWTIVWLFLLQSSAVIATLFFYHR